MSGTQRGSSVCCANEEPGQETGSDCCCCWLLQFSVVQSGRVIPRQAGNLAHSGEVFQAMPTEATGAVVVGGCDQDGG